MFTVVTFSFLQWSNDHFHIITVSMQLPSDSDGEEEESCRRQVRANHSPHTTIAHTQLSHITCVYLQGLTIEYYSSTV